MSKINFTVQCTMEERWVTSFIEMLESMRYCGNIGHSEYIGLYSDGDGDFRPKFYYDATLRNIGNPPRVIKNPSGQMTMYDAG